MGSSPCPLPKVLGGGYDLVMKTYKTLAALVKAYKSGKIDRTGFVFMLDNDYVTVDSHACAYEADLVTVLEEALDLLGVPWDYV